MKLIDPFMQPKGRGKGKRAGATLGRQFSVQMGNPGPEAEAAVQAMLELGRRQRIAKRLGAQAVIKAERR